MSLEQEREVTAGPYTGCVSGTVSVEALCEWARDLREHVVSPQARVIADGRNRNVQIEARIDGQIRQVHVKSFGGQSAFKDLRARRFGSKAQRTWRAARHLSRKEVPTPQPLAVFERIEGGRAVESYFISEFEADTISFADALSVLFKGDPQCHAFMDLMQFVADAIRGMHEAGFQHNDLGNQNILLQRDPGGHWTRALFIDLNRGRIEDALTLRQRARDMSRIFLPSDLLRVFIEMYFRDVPPETFLSWQSHYRARFALHTCSRPFRHPIRALRSRRNGTDSDVLYPHPRDMWIFDQKSAQAIVTTRSRDRRRYYPLAKGLIPLGASIRYWARIRSASQTLRACCFEHEQSLQGRIGLGIDPRMDALDRQEALLDALGNPPVLVRLYHHQDLAQWRFRTDTIRRWATSGRSVAVALVQDRNATLKPDQWRDFVARSLEACAEHAAFIEVGHAINRVKWGLWDLNEWGRLMTPLLDITRAYPNVRLTGPAVIDFEYPVAVGALDRLPQGIHYHAMSHHLYVDRRGAPENKQGRYDTLEKLIAGRAIARVMPACEDRLIISEVNWPLAGTQEYSPVTSPYESPGPRLNDPNVSEDDYADFMLRYLCIALCSGMAHQVFWWRLVARGFGLVDDTQDTAWRERPAFKVLQRFLALLGDAVFCKRFTRDVAGTRPAIVYLFKRADGENVGLVYRVTDEIHDADALTRLDLSASGVEDVFGQTLDMADVRVGGRPIYLRGVDLQS